MLKHVDTFSTKKKKKKPCAIFAQDVVSIATHPCMLKKQNEAPLQPNGHRASHMKRSIPGVIPS